MHYSYTEESLTGVKKNNVDACPCRTFQGNVSFVVKFYLREKMVGGAG